MNSRLRKILQAIYRKPVPNDIRWADIEELLIALEADIEEGNGSRVRVRLIGVRAVFHRPYPQSTTKAGAVRAAAQFLREAGVNDEP